MTWLSLAQHLEKSPFLDLKWDLEPTLQAFWSSHQDMFVIYLEFLIEMFIFLEVTTVYSDCQIFCALLLHW